MLLASIRTTSRHALAVGALPAFRRAVARVGASKIVLGVVDALAALEAARLGFPLRRLVAVPQVGEKLAGKRNVTPLALRVVFQQRRSDVLRCRSLLI